jgi:hypothetical protein
VWFSKATVLVPVGMVVLLGYTGAKSKSSGSMEGEGVKSEYS